MKIKRHYPGSREATAPGIPGELDDGKTNSQEYIEVCKSCSLEMPECKSMVIVFRSG